MNYKALFTVPALVLLTVCPVLAQSLVAPQDFTAFDTPNDNGASISLTWKVTEQEKKVLEQEKKLSEQYKNVAVLEKKLSGLSEQEKNSLEQEKKELGQNEELFEQNKKACGIYVIYASFSKDGPWKVQDDQVFPNLGFKSDAPQYFGLGDKNKEWHFYEITGFKQDPKDDNALPITSTMYFKLAVTDGANTVEFPAIVSATPVGNWFDMGKLYVLIFVVIFFSLIMIFISIARKNPNLFIRHIPGLDAIEETIGRATEMGKPILYLNGLLDMSALSTIASTSILGKVARKVANYDSQIMVPCYDPIVMSVCQEVVKEAYVEVGRPDAFREDNIFFITNDQFAYAAAVDGLIVRHKPAATLFMGYYYAESLLIAETGAAIGAMQIAGTDAITQLPFFITTCDYTLMGEELYAASAYLSREPLQLGSLKGQDYSKAFIILVLLFGSILSTADIVFVVNLFKTF